MRLRHIVSSLKCYFNTKVKLNYGLMGTNPKFEHGGFKTIAKSTSPTDCLVVL